MIREFWVAAALFAIAAVTPLLWSAVDSQRRAELKAAAFVACVAHHRVDQCDGMRPAVVPPSAIVVCEMRNSQRECARLMEAR